MQFIRPSLVLALTLAVLAGCGGGGTTTLNNLSPPGSSTISGTVSGLPAGKSIVLDAMGNAITLSSNGAFNATMPVATGSPYTVTIGTQPAGGNCTLTGGSGTAGAANNASIGITCATTDTLTIGGTVAGLASGQSVVLDDNGGNALTVSTSGAFTFTTALAGGSAYAVTVSTQPTGQTCTVASGSGTVSSANIANVVVTCSDQAYTLGGTIQGLNTSGLVLADGSNTVAVNSGATSFTLPTPVAYTSSYAVTVKTQPTGLSCTVTAGTGTMPAHAVTNVSVICTDQPFTLGGTVSGLGAYTGLVLANAGQSYAVPASATSFVLPTPVRFGSAYAVTLQGAPAGLTCTISNGSGTVPASNVTNIAVTCADQSYTVGGSISGLTVSGLVLAIGSSTLSVPANSSSFTMPTAVAFGSTYAVTVHTQPTNFTCTVSNGSGTIGTNPVSNVTVTCAQTVFTVGGAISGLTASGLVLANGSDTLSVAANATQFTMPTGVANGATYHITVQSHPAAVACTVTNGAGTVAAANVTNITIACAPSSVSFTNGQAASVVIGQNVFTTNGSGVSATTLDGPWGGVSLNQGIMYITDYGNTRILGYNSIPTQNGAAADFVIGQTNFSSNSSGTTASTLKDPWANSISGSTLIVADTNNNRVLLFNPVPTATGASASIVVGQSSMTASGSGCTASNLQGPGEALEAAGKLVVADYDNSRILIWNTIPSTNGVAADIVVGQPNMTTCTTNTGGISASSLNYPGDVWTDGTKLIVADSGNNRVLVWNTFPTSNNAPADLVIGQTSFSASSANQGGAPSASTIWSSSSYWSSVTSYSGQIFISDYNNNRVLIYNTFPTTNGAAADNVLGQPNFTSNSAASPPTASSLNGVGGVSIHGSQFFLTDYNNNRVLIFDGQ